MQPWRTTQVYPSSRWKKFIVELLLKGHILHSFRMSNSNFISPRNHTQPTLSIQAQVTVTQGVCFARCTRFSGLFPALRRFRRF